MNAMFKKDGNTMIHLYVKKKGNDCMEKEMERTNYNFVKDFLESEDGIGVVEIVLILVVLIGLVIIFKSQLTSLMKTILNNIKSDALSI